MGLNIVKAKMISLNLIYLCFVFLILSSLVIYLFIFINTHGSTRLFFFQVNTKFMEIYILEYELNVYEYKILVLCMGFCHLKHITNWFHLHLHPLVFRCIYISITKCNYATLFVVRILNNCETNNRLKLFSSKQSGTNCTKTNTISCE